MEHEEIAKEVLEDYGFDIVVLVTVDKGHRLQISGADTCKEHSRLTVSMLRRVVETIKEFLGWRREGNQTRGGNQTLH
jgi:hypothetical protein